MSRILSIALVVFATGVASLHVSASFTRSRHVVVREPTTPDVAGTVTVEVPPSAVPLTVIIVRASGNGDGVALRFRRTGNSYPRSTFRRVTQRSMCSRMLICVSAFEFARRENRLRALSLLLALVPAACWRLYVGWRLAPAFGLRAFWSDPGDLTFPLAGFVKLWLVDGVCEPSNLVFPILLVALLALSVATFRARPGPIPAAASAYALLGVSLSLREDLGMGRQRRARHL